MARGAKKGGINNWLLLIRIAVINPGILLAFAPAGIPMDKITITIGSLGVGICLGLQNIAGNLFSGSSWSSSGPLRSAIK